MPRLRYTVIGLLDQRFQELLIAGVVEGWQEVTRTAPMAGGYECVYYHTETSSPAAAEQAVRNEVENM